MTTSAPSSISDYNGSHRIDATNDTAANDAAAPNTAATNTASNDTASNDAATNGNTTYGNVSAGLRPSPVGDTSDTGYPSDTNNARDASRTTGQTGNARDADKAALRRAAITRRLRISRAQRAEAGIALVAALRDSGLLESLRPGDTVAAYVSMGSEIPTRPLLRLLLDTGLRALVPRLGSGMEVGWGALTDVRALRPMEGDTADTAAAGAAAVTPVSGTALAGTAAAITATADTTIAATTIADKAAEDGSHSGSSRRADVCRTNICQSDARQPNALQSDARLPDAQLPKTHRHRPDEPDAETLEPQALRDARLILVPAFAVDRDGTRLGRGGGWYDRALMHRASGTPIVAICWPWESLQNATSALLPRRPHDVAVSGVLTPTGLTWLHS